MTKVKYAAKAEFFDCGSRQESSLLLIHWRHKLISVDDVSGDAGSFVSSSLKQHQNPHWLSLRSRSRHVIRPTIGPGSCIDRSLDRRDRGA
jgi:hypothetical protein